MVQRVQHCYSWFMFEVAVAGVVEDVSLLLLVMSSVLRDRIAQCTSQQWTRFPSYTAAMPPLLLDWFLTAMQLPFVTACVAACVVI